MSHHHHKLEEIAENLRRLFREVLGEEIMAQIQFALTLTVNPSAPPLAESASSGSVSFTQGTQGSVVLAAITGGVPPYTASVDAASSPLPPGLAAGIDASNNLIVSGTPTASGGPVQVTLDVVDSLGAQVASVKAKA